MQPRDENGRLVAANCPDPNCGGVLVYEREAHGWWGPARHTWRCDGLTHDDRSGGELIACPRFVEGPVIPRAIA